ncbi:MAG TPA: prolipoprotein diacylglyceryl transferase family protein, partial [Flavobacteriales bacterium]|nr:prolipoprotein diacylglyceryl transferase family protein [Flavobacteriales bacterium]
MYPTLYHALLDLTGIGLTPLKFLNSFGFFVALGFVGAYLTLASELRRKTALGLLKPTMRIVVVGGPAKPMDLFLQGLVGFIIGWKGLYLLFNLGETTADPPAFLLSGKGSFIGGIAVGAWFVWMLWREKQKQRKAEPEVRTVPMQAVDHAGNITITAAVWGFIGAKVFSWFEGAADFQWSAFVAWFEHPIDHLRAIKVTDIVSGLTMYGGLIVAGIMVMRYFRKHGLAFWPSVDAAAPGVLLAYGIGRLGCQVSGDGDWGIANTTPAPAWMPSWLWSYDYPNNVNNAGVEMVTGTKFPGYGHHLAAPVFPTPLYEAIACVLLFVVLWKLRKRITIPGVMFCLFLVFD